MSEGSDVVGLGGVLELRLVHLHLVNDFAAPEAGVGEHCDSFSLLLPLYWYSLNYLRVLLEVLTKVPSVSPIVSFLK